MKLAKVQLTRNLRRSLLRGHPWVYKEAIKGPTVNAAQLAQVLDQKGQSLGWAIYDPHGPLSLRMLSLEKRAPEIHDYIQLLDKAWSLRQSIKCEGTNLFRLINGEGDLLPGLICDIYNNTAVIQFDGQGPSEFWSVEWMEDWILKNNVAGEVLVKPRHDFVQDKGSLITKERIVEAKENSVTFFVDIVTGQKTGFFIDQRENRQYLKQWTKNKSFLNLFSYTGGFSVYAGLGGANQVCSVDISPKALELAEKNWVANELDLNKHVSECSDVEKFLSQDTRKWEAIMVDPPSMAPSEKQKPGAIAKYTELFQLAARKVKPEGHLFLSSCSSHIHFDDFFEIITQALSQARRKGQILRVSGQGPDHPYPHALPEFRYLKFVHLKLD